MSDNIHVHPSGKLAFAGTEYTCALGKGGVTSDKQEGDETTPLGCFALRRVWYRPDRTDEPETSLSVRTITETDGWCDDPSDENYNQPVKLPYEASHEELWKEDNIYDVVVELGYNDDPPVPGKGSAIFMHVARPDYSGTEGCIALAKDDLLEVLKNAQSTTKICVYGGE